MALSAPASNVLRQLDEVLAQLNDQQYRETLDIFSGSSLGMHTRHILEFYICLLHSQKGEKVCYDERERKKELEDSVRFARKCISGIISSLGKLNEDQKVVLKAQLGDDNFEIESSYYRELIYVIEHAVHHMAIIKMGVLAALTHVQIPSNFGVAESTIRYTEKCAQ